MWRGAVRYMFEWLWLCASSAAFGRACGRYADYTSQACRGTQVDPGFGSTARKRLQPRVVHGVDDAHHAPSLGLADNCGQGVLCVLHDAGAALDTVAHQRSVGDDANECTRSKLGLFRRRKGRLAHSRNKIEDGRETVGQVGKKLWKVVGRMHVRSQIGAVRGRTPGAIAKPACSQRQTNQPSSVVWKLKPPHKTPGQAEKC